VTFVEAPVVGPDRILKLGHTFRAAKTLLSAVELGVFTALADGPLDLQAASKRVGIHERGARDFFVPGHDSRLGQVVDNLIDNARSFSPPGAAVRVTARRLKTEIEIVVDDDGPGVRPEALDKIFERFYTDRPHQGFGQNSGLGLSISKQIVEAHSGHILVENRMAAATGGWPAKVLGARFTVRLPAMRSAPQPA
jgi:two-component system sensor histidine kinase ChvG